MAASVILVRGQEKSFEERFPVVPGRWSVEKINTWHYTLLRFVGTNYHPSTAINQIAMQLASTWGLAVIEVFKELSDKK